MRIKTETVVGLFMLSAFAVFLFMSFKIGIWRLDVVRYAHYVTYFSDVSGLNEKSDICIAGVKVGWVQKLSLISRTKQVRVDMMIDRASTIYANASAAIRQNGLLGTKYVEVTVGDNEHSILPPGSAFIHANKPSVQIDEILSTFKEIADNVNEVTSSLKKVISDEKNTNNFAQLISDAQKAFQRIENVAESTNRIVSLNEDKISSLISNASMTFDEIKNSLPGAIGSIKNGFESISKKIDVIGDSFIKAGDSISGTMEPIRNITTKLEKGDGLLPTLLSDSDLTKEVKSTVSGLKKYLTYADRIGIDVDTHVESMQGLGNDLDFKDAKGYFNFLIRPADDIYYLVGITSSYAGVVKRIREDRLYFDQEKHQYIPNYMNIPDWAKLQYAPVQETYKRKYAAVTFNIQLAKEFGRFNCRAGIFENTFGFGVDYFIPLFNETKWVTSLELYRFNEFMSQTIGGRLVFDIDMPHLKWYNRVFVNDDCYFVFGIDDFISKFNKNFFVGMGIDFEQDDLKYLSSSLK